MVVFRCKRSGNTVSFVNDADIAQLRAHEGYDEVIVEAVVETTVEPVVETTVEPVVETTVEPVVEIVKPKTRKISNKDQSLL